ncbi:MAG: hypothetical protein LBS19_03450 [Clostridiales bacterium]|jgi:hypothetical protein|nr:hypothetical protein [Clostridiales bacterium]
MCEHDLVESLRRYIGRTVTIFTTSGGLSGSGFTGVLAAVCEGTVKLITDIGAPPACCVGSACGGGNYGGCGGGNALGANVGGCNGGGYGWLGSVTEIPVCKIASFTHSAI